MRLTVFLAAQLLLGVYFLIFGTNGFVHFLHLPPEHGDAQTFSAVLERTHFWAFVYGAEILAGALLLVNRAVPFALVVLAAIIANVIVFHATMEPGGALNGAIALVLWIVACWPYRAIFATLFTNELPTRVEIDRPDAGRNRLRTA